MSAQRRVLEGTKHEVGSFDQPRGGSVEGRRSGSSREKRLRKENAGGNERDAIHPAVLRADHLEIEVEELRVLRERDKQRFELMLAEAESAKGKLLRQVKFLSEEEEAARAQYKRKQEDFFAETSRLHEALVNERKALAEMNEEKGGMSDHERLGFERKLEREAGAKRVAEEKAEILEDQADAQRQELQELRERVREGDAAKAKLSREVAALRREVGGGGSVADGSSWDTPVARELRGKIKTLEREARKREELLQDLENDRRNAIVLEDQVRTLEDKLQRTEGSLREAIVKQADRAAIEDEKCEWSMVFAEALREEGTGGKGWEGDMDTRPSPLIALRFLAKAQEERSLAVKDLTALQLRYEADSKRLAVVEQGLKKERERASSSEVWSEELQLKVEALQRRCRSAEHEVAAQKELIQSYERDAFRKPAGELWLSDHSKLEAALSSAKDEASALREASEGQISAPEAMRLRGKLSKAEAELKIATKERDEAMEMGQELEDRLEVLEKERANGTGSSNGKVLHMKNNPSAMAAEEVKKDLKRQLETLKEDKNRLVHQLESAASGALNTSVSGDGSLLFGSSGMKVGETPDPKKFNVRLQEEFKARINVYREFVYRLTGYRIDMIKDPLRQVLRLRSMYAANESDSLVFQSMDGGLHLTETDLARQHQEKIDLYLQQCDSIPAFLSSLTLEWFEQQTAVPR